MPRVGEYWMRLKDRSVVLIDRVTNTHVEYVELPEVRFLKKELGDFEKTYSLWSIE